MLVVSGTLFHGASRTMNPGTFLLGSGASRLGGLVYCSISAISVTSWSCAQEKIIKTYDISNYVLNDYNDVEMSENMMYKCMKLNIDIP